jgi:2-polyprenyl-6-methoxyphenol hydroxylase-like FAD-dependent oxidoreductase
VREGFQVAGLIEDDGFIRGIKGQSRGTGEAEERARIVIGADGRNSLVAKLVGAAAYNVRPVLTCAYYAYWRGVSAHQPAIHPRPQRLIVSFPTNDGMTITPIIFPKDEFRAVRADPDRAIRASLDLVGDFAEPFRQAERVEPVRGSGTLPTSSESPTATGGLWSAMRAITRTRSWRRASQTPSAARSGWLGRLMRGSRGRNRSVRHWRTTSEAAMSI